MKQKQLYALLFLLTCLGMTGCSVKNEDVPGSYVLRYPYATELLLLKSNSEYIQLVIIDSDTAALTNRGKWSYRHNSELVLENALRVDNGFGQLDSLYAQPKQGGSMFPIEGYCGDIYIVRNEDLGFKYERIDDWK